MDKSIFMRRSACFLFAAVLLAGCGALTPSPDATNPPLPKNGSDQYPVWYATNRLPRAAQDEAQGYSERRDNKVHYGKAFVTIPTDYLSQLRNQAAGSRPDEKPGAEP